MVLDGAGWCWNLAGYCAKGVRLPRPPLRYTDRTNIELYGTGVMLPLRAFTSRCGIGSCDTRASLAPGDGMPG